MPEPVTVYVPPEVAGTLFHAQRHLTNSKNAGYWYANRAARRRAAKHAEKFQKLIARAARLMAARGVSCP